MRENSKNLQLLDIQAFNSANKAAFQNPTKGLSTQWSIDVKSVVTSIGILAGLLTDQMEHCSKRLFVWIWKDCFLAEL